MALKSKNKIEKPRRKSSVLLILASLLVTSVLGSATGTFAWFEYQARAGFQYHGTAIGEVESLKVGLYTDIELPNYADYNVEKDGNYYWAEAGLSGGFISYYCELSKHSFKELGPTTSGKYTDGDDLSLKPAPTKIQNYLPTSKAETRNYVFIPLAFKVVQDTGVGVGQHSIFLNDVGVAGTGSIKKGMRVYFNGENATNFIFNPNVDEDGYDVVAGPLDLDLNGFYDYEDLSDHEFCYGEYGDLVYLEPNDDVSPYPKEERSTFTSAHARGIKPIDVINSDLAKSNYLGKKSTIFNRELARSDVDSNIIHLDITIYLEGWSSYTIDKEINNYFSCDFIFELQELNK